MLVIVIEERFVNPNLGGNIQRVLTEFAMHEGDHAKEKYWQLRKEADQSGGCYDVTIDIVVKKEKGE